MTKKRFLCCLCLAIFTAVSLFGFTACSNGSSYDDSALVDRIEALEEQITSLENDILISHAALRRPPSF